MHPHRLSPLIRNLFQLSMIGLFFSGATQVSADTPIPPGPPETPTDMILIDHTSVDLFEDIPVEYIALARDTRMLFSDRSVGVNIYQGLDCLAAAQWYLAPAHCRRDYYGNNGSLWLSKTFSRTDFENNLVPPNIQFDPDPVLFDHSNWTFEYRSGTWEELIENFVTDLVPTYTAGPNPKTVFSLQLSYLNIDSGSNIADLEEGFFADQPHDDYYPARERWDISDLEDLEAQYPNTVFIYSTANLARSIGTAEGQIFNEQMRQYALDNGKILFDIADMGALKCC